MKSRVVAVVLALAALANASEVSPIEKVIQMINDLEKKVIKEGEEAQKIYDEFSEFCEDKSRDLGFEIKTGKAEVAELKATIEEETANIAALESKIEELSSDIQSSEKELDAATKVREREAADFAVEEKELTETLSMLERATSILSREMEKAAKGGAAMLQLKGATSLTQAFSAMVQASMLNSADASKLTALVQTSHESEDDDQEPGAPAAAVYEGQSGGIIATLEGLTEKAQSQLDTARKEESESAHNYEMLKQSLTDAIKFANKDMDKAKTDLAESQENKATAEGDLETTQKDLDEDIKAKEQLHTECMEGATEFEMTTKSRGEELAALAEAKKVIKEATGGAAEQTYSFLQVASDASMTHVEAERFIRTLARKTHAPALAQLASRISSIVRLSSASGADPFAKVEGLIQDMIATLEKEAEEDAAQKAYCDKEMGENNAKKDDLTAESDKLSTKIAQDSAHSKKLKEEVATLQKELASMAKARAEADKLRVEEKETFEKNSAELAMGIEGVKKALSVLKEYYSKDDKDHESNDGAASGIIGLLEVCESDFTKGLTEMTAEEESSAKAYKDYCNEDDISRAKKEKAVEYKTQEAAALDKKVSELQNDLAGVTDELDAVNKALDKLKEMCIAKPESYEERKKRRDSEIAGLKEALQILDGEAVLLQKTSKHTLRGARRHHA